MSEITAGDEVVDKELTDKAQLQHPANIGEEGIEVAERSQDVHTQSTTNHKKTIVIPKSAWGKPSTQDVKDFHERQYTAVRQYLMNQGMRPVGAVSLASKKDHPDGASLIFTYQVQVQAAHVLPQLDEAAHATAVQGDEGRSKSVDNQDRTPVEIEGSDDATAERAVATDPDAEVPSGTPNADAQAEANERAAKDA